MSILEKDSQPLSWNCEVCGVTIFSLYPKQFRQNVTSHKKSRKHRNKVARFDKAPKSATAEEVTRS